MNVDIRNVHWIEPDFITPEDCLQKPNHNILYYQKIKNNKIIFEKRRLVTTSLNGNVVEWDLLTDIPKSTFTAGGAIYDSK